MKNRTRSYFNKRRVTIIYRTTKFYNKRSKGFFSTASCFPSYEQQLKTVTEWWKSGITFYLLHRITLRSLLHSDNRLFPIVVSWSKPKIVFSQFFTLNSIYCMGCSELLIAITFVSIIVLIRSRRRPIYGELTTYRFRLSAQLGSSSHKEMKALELYSSQLSPSSTRCCLAYFKISDWLVKLFTVDDDSLCRTACLTVLDICAYFYVYQCLANC